MDSSRARKVNNMTKNINSRYIEIKNIFQVGRWSWRNILHIYGTSATILAIINCSALELGHVGRKSYILAFLRDLSSDVTENCFPSAKRNLLAEFDIFLIWSCKMVCNRIRFKNGRKRSEGERGEAGHWGNRISEIFFAFLLVGQWACFFNRAGGWKIEWTILIRMYCLYSIEISRLVPERYASLQTSSFIFVIIDVCCAVTRKKRVLTFNSELCIALLW